MKKRYPILVLLLALAVTGCKTKGVRSEAIVFSDNEIYNGASTQVCHLDESEDILGSVQDFAMINDTTFVVLDGQNALLYDTHGKRLKQFGYRGRGNGEMISPSRVAVTPKRVYIWCSSLMKVVAFSHDGILQGQYTDFERGVKKFAADDRYLFLCTSGYRNEAGDKVEDIIQVYDMQKGKITKMFGERPAVDEVMAVYSNSGGIAACQENIIMYVNPGSLNIFTATADGRMLDEYLIYDEDFTVEKVKDITSITDYPSEWMAFITRNSVVRGAFVDDSKTYVVAEIGVFPSQDGTSEGNRKTKVYILDHDKSPLKTITFDFVSTPSFMVMDGKLFFISTEIGDGYSDQADQMVYLNYFPLNQS